MLRETRIRMKPLYCTVEDVTRRGDGSWPAPIDFPAITKTGIAGRGTSPASNNNFA